MLDPKYAAAIKEGFNELEVGDGIISLGDGWVEQNIRPFNPELADKCIQMMKLQEEVDKAFDELYDQVGEEEEEEEED